MFSKRRLEVKPEPIAIISMAARFPGLGKDTAGFWQMLSEKKDATTKIPADRWLVEKYYSSERRKIGKTNTQSGAFIQQNIEDFDAAFFGISHQEATYLDPQQRLLMEVVWEALEAGNIDADQLVQSPTGIYIGIASQEYAAMIDQLNLAERSSGYTETGNALSMTAGRMAHWLGCQGPTMSIDTSGSSSLVALHQACQSIRSGESRMAIVGGVELLLSPRKFIAFSQLGVLAIDGKSKAFDKNADGYGLGEGCGVVILKRLSEALAENDNILAVIKGSALNHNGETANLTAPNGSAQEELIHLALENAHLSPNDIDYIEANGAGSQLGDAVELDAIQRVFLKQQEQAGIKGSLTGPKRIARSTLIDLALKDGQMPIIERKKLANFVYKDSLDMDIYSNPEPGRVSKPLFGNALESFLIEKLLWKKQTAERTQPLIIGSAKTYLGHLGAAAGMAGFIKTILSLQHAQIPCLLHFNSLNHHMNKLSDSDIVLPIEAKEWGVKEQRTRRAGISSFGLSGTNAHVIIEEAPKNNAVCKLIEDNAPQLFVFSAKCQEALQALKEKYIRYLRHTQDRLQDIAYTSAVGRKHFNYRIAVIAHSKENLIERLENPEDAFANENPELHAVAKSYLAHKEIDWQHYYEEQPDEYRKVSLPTYAFQRRPYWIESISQTQHLASDKQRNLSAHSSL